MICVFDIESIPDIHLLNEHFDFSGSPLDIALMAFAAQKEKSGSEFLPLSFHRVISISSAICDDYGHFVKVGHFGRSFLDSLYEKVHSKTNECVKKPQKVIESAQDAVDSINVAESATALDSITSPSTKQSTAKTYKKAKNMEEINMFSKGFLDSLECTLISEFWTFFNKNQPKLVSFNGRGFDIPLLLLRAMRYDINATAYYEQDNPVYNKSKWENYRQRYSEGFHTDLLDSLGGFGAVRSLRLDDICKMLDLVGKYDMSGEQVFQTYFNAKDDSTCLNALTTINHYCHSDVLNTYWLYLKYELLKGHIIESDYVHLLQSFLANLPDDKPYSKIFQSTLKRHIARYVRD